MSFSGTKGYITKPKPGVMLNPLHPLSRGLVGYWLFNEGSGSLANDISGKDNHGILTNMSPNAQSSGWGGSKFGGKLNFDGIDDYISIPDKESLDLQGQVTISFWLEWYGTSGIDTIISQTTVGNDNYALALDGTSDKFNVWLANGDADNFTSSTLGWSLGTLHHVVVGIDNINNTYIFLIDGINDGQQALSGNFTNVQSQTHIGKSRFANQYLYGGLCQLCVYNLLLNLSEMKQLSQNPFCNLLQLPLRRYSVAAPPPISVYAGLMMQMIKHDKVIL